jgi:murein DD-endopeptidase MepM/ murein hydrolase activator NlpD
MERPDDKQSRGWSVVIIPKGSRGAVREYSVTAGQLKRFRWVAAAIFAVFLPLAIVAAVTVPRSIAYPGLVEENRVLRERLKTIDRRMAEVDRVLLRLRLYDAHIRSLSEPNGDHGPLPEEAFANSRLLSVLEDVQSDEVADDARSLQPSDLRPAEAWAFAVEARVDTFLALFEMAEPDLNQLVVELEDLRALQEALPRKWPARGHLTSGFGFRPNPFGYSPKFHSGLDIAARRGTPIYAAAAGKVVRAEYNAGYGRMLELDHGFGITTVYAHCTSLRVRKGAEVREGQYIATMGATGRVTGPHLHFEVRLEGHPVDPLEYLPH